MYVCFRAVRACVSMRRCERVEASRRRRRILTLWWLARLYRVRESFERAPACKHINSKIVCVSHLSGGDGTSVQSGKACGHPRFIVAFGLLV